MKPISVLICDDSALIRKLFSDLLAGQDDIQVVDTAVDAADAREKIKRLNPDVLTLDIEMPGMDGLSFLEKIMTLRPMPVIMASTLTQKGAGETIRALELGAVDYISKPQGTSLAQSLPQLREELIIKVRTAARANLKLRHHAPVAAKSVVAFQPAGGVCRNIIAIGSSTGGVEALRDLFLMLPENCPPVVITQHMPERFTTSFAARLNGLSQVKVAEAEKGAKLTPGQAWLAPGGWHLCVVRKGADLVCQIDQGELVSGHRPSVDVMFDSVAAAVGAPAVGVILTGMGKDGAAGMKKMRDAGAFTIGQNEQTCVVYGMPKAAMAAGAVQVELPLNAIAGRMLVHCQSERISHAG